MQNSLRHKAREAKEIVRARRSRAHAEISDPGASLTLRLREHGEVLDLRRYGMPLRRPRSQRLLDPIGEFDLERELLRDEILLYPRAW